MAVDRTLRDELAAAVVAWMRQETTTEQLWATAERIREAGYQGMHDLLCGGIANDVQLVVNEMGVPFVWTRPAYDEVARWVAKLRSDGNGEDPAGTMFERVSDAGRRRLLIRYVLVVAIVTLAVTVWRGPAGLLVWPAASLPMWWGAVRSLSRPMVGRHDVAAITQMPGFPSFDELRGRNTWGQRAMFKLRYYAAIVGTAPTVVLMVAFGSLIWPQLLNLNWVEQDRVVPVRTRIPEKL